jgi:hypothetical protein
MSNLKLGCPSLHKKNGLQKKWDFIKVCIFFKWRDMKIKKIWTFENGTLWPPFFWKSCLFLRTEMDNLPSIFTSNTMQCISIDWYLERRTFMLYATVKTPRSPQQATNWSGIKNGELSKKVRLSGYQSIDKKHILVHVKFEVGSSTSLTKKKNSKKVRLFQGLSVSSSNGGRGWPPNKQKQFNPRPC